MAAFDLATAKGRELIQFNSTLPTIADGDVGFLQGDASGRGLPSDANTYITVVASALVTPSTVNTDITNLYGRAALMFVDITAVAGTTHTLDVKLQIKDALSGKFFDWPGVAIAQKNAISTTMVQIIPNIAEVANLAVSNNLPSVFRVVQTVGGSGVTPSVTYSISMVVLR